MINDVEIARQISDLIIDIGARLDSSVQLVQDNCTLEELSEYRRAVGSLMGEMLLRIMNPLYRQHPALKPPELK